MHLHKGRVRKLVAVVKKTLACDKCGSEEGVTRYNITFPNAGRRTCDLCIEDKVPLDELEKLYKARPRGRKPAARVVSEKDIEQARKRKSRTVKKS